MGARDAAFAGIAPFHHLGLVASWTALAIGARSDVRPMLQSMSPVIGPLLTSVVNVAMPALGVGADQGPTDMDFGS